ncbi:MAG: DNA translocase FtsK [Alphaproteobacteria bacterium]|jgi:S-DNA-T family DNA segregation ATPase FtsK/SpoIIIE
MAKKQKFLPESIRGIVRDIFFRGIGVLLLFIGIWFCLALFFHNPYLDGFATSSTFGRQSLIGNFIGFVLYGIGFIPALFVFLFIIRNGVSMMLKWEEFAPEYNIIRAFITTIIGSFGFGTILPSKSWGGLIGAIVAHDIGIFAKGWTFIFGIIFITLFLFMAGTLLNIKWQDVKAFMQIIKKWMGVLLNILKLQPIKYKKIKDIEEEAEEVEEIEEVVEKEKTSKPRRKQIDKTNKQSTSIYKLPPPEFLELSEFAKLTITNDLKRHAINLETNFADYNVYGKVVGIKPGPIVTLYEFEPDAGQRMAKITDTVKDMTRAMATESIRIAHIPRSNYVGVELVNVNRQLIRFRSLVTDDAFINSKYHIPLALGVNIAGIPVYYDLSKMPHLLIAGRTGSGKSVFIQSIIMSIVYHFTPDKCKLIIIDPKGVDFALWQDIPHLITPIVSDPNMGVNTLKWAVREMEDRYKKLKDLKVQNLENYNKTVAELRTRGEKVIKQVPVGTDSETGALEYEDQELDLSDIPHLVIIVEEFGDLMTVARKEVEACIQRLAQKARAAGIHIVIATQRPDTTVITGVIKANLPTRISFQARSNIDSITTLGEKGAEQLLQAGDMLFSESGRTPIRIHGAFIENKEIKKVADFLRTQGSPDYIDGIGESNDEYNSGIDGNVDVSDIPGMMTSKEAKDADQYRQAVECVVRDNRPTISYVQRRLGVGYNKAAGFIERMEREGIVSGPDANNKRHLL